MRMNKKAMIPTVIILGVAIFISVCAIDFANKINGEVTTELTKEAQEENHQILLDTCEQSKIKWQKALGLQTPLPNDCESLVEISEDAHSN